MKDKFAGAIYSAADGDEIVLDRKVGDASGFVYNKNPQSNLPVVHV